MIQMEKIRLTLHHALIKHLATALLTAAASITVAVVKHKIDSQASYKALSEKFNSLIDQSKRDHDDLLLVKGNLEILIAMQLKEAGRTSVSKEGIGLGSPGSIGHGSGFGRGAGRIAGSARPTLAPIPPPPSHPSPPPQAAAANVPQVSAMAASPEENLKKLKTSIDSPIFKSNQAYQVKQLPTKLDDVLK